MKSTSSMSLAVIALLVVAEPSQAGPQQPARDILGLRLSMTEKQAHARLQELGALVRKEGMNQEVWKVNANPSYSNILIGVTKDERLRYVTAVAREDKEAQRVPYSSIGDLKVAKQAGDAKIKVFNYQWTLPEGKGEPETLVLAIGRDSENLSMLSLKRLGAGAEAQDED
ncbi:MAG: hypothetical protein ACR2NX_07890 [Chthoniobacterales bacterium]